VRGPAVWLRVAADTAILLVLLTMVAAPLGLVVFGRYAEARGEEVPAWADLTRRETQRDIAVLFVALAVLQVLERVVRGNRGWSRRRRGATMASPGSQPVSAPPVGVPRGSAHEKGSDRNGRQVSQSDAEEDSAEEGSTGQESAEVTAPLVAES
jgi:hypothetical protein